MVRTVLPTGYSLPIAKEDFGHPMGFASARPIGARTHLWTPREMQAVFEEDRHVVGCCHLSGL